MIVITGTFIDDSDDDDDDVVLTRRYRLLYIMT